MLMKRVIVCLDVRDGRVTKGVRFKNNVDVGDPVELAREYGRQGVDELVFYDIAASAEQRGIMIGTVGRVAAEVFIPFSVGGGISDADQMREVLWAGAEKISVNSAAVRNPGIISDGARRFGSQCIVAGIDIKADETMPSGYRVWINGGRKPTGLDVMQWALETQRLGAGEIVANVMDADGTGNGYDIKITRRLSRELSIPVVASGGAGRPEHIRDVFADGCADAALVAGMAHSGRYTVGDIKSVMKRNGIPVRMDGISDISTVSKDR